MSDCFDHQNAKDYDAEVTRKRAAKSLLDYQEMQMSEFKERLPDHLPCRCPLCEYALSDWACRFQGFIVGVLVTAGFGAAAWWLLA